MKELAYRTDIDGLRAFAVVPVILFHMGFQWIAGGYIGVDVFFVISGFLITSILKKEIEAGTFTFRGFCSRRIRRILPALIVMTAGSLIVTYAFVFKPDRATIAAQASSGLLSIANFYFWRNAGNYWGQQADESPFLHTWSLSVEEQFYIFFPLAMWLIYRFVPRYLQKLMLFAVVSSLLLFLYGSIHNPSATFYLLPTRAWELAAGGLLAVTYRATTETSPVAASLNTFSLTGLCLILLCYVAVPQLNGGVAIAVLGAILILAFGQSGSSGQFLSLPPIVHIGRLSYSLYLWHWPILVFARYFEMQLSKWLLLIPIYGLSLFSYYLIESPLRRRTGSVPLILTAHTLVLGFCVMIVTSPRDYDTSDFITPHWYGRYFDVKPSKQLSPEFEVIASTLDVPEREVGPDAYKTGGIIVGEGNSKPRIVVLGDSHGVMWSGAIRSVVENLGIKTSFISMNGQPVFFKLPIVQTQKNSLLSPLEKFEYDTARLELIKEWKPQVVILCSRWAQINESDTPDLLRYLELHAGRILFLEQPPELAKIGNRNALQYFCYKGFKPEDGVRKYFPIGNMSQGVTGRNLIRNLCQEHAHSSVIPVYDLYANGDEALILDGRNVVYVDDDHLTTFGTSIAIPRIEQAISEAFALPYSP